MDDLRCLAAEANLVNPTVTSERLLRAIRNPKKAIEILLSRSNVKKK